MAKADEYRLAIERAVIKAELAPSDEIKRMWVHIRQHYEELLMLALSIELDFPPRKFIK